MIEKRKGTNIDVHKRLESTTEMTGKIENRSGS